MDCFVNSDNWYFTKMSEFGIKILPQNCPILVKTVIFGQWLTRRGVGWPAAPLA